jgi:asparagine synthase (glutamine-hydrolysing)
VLPAYYCARMARDDGVTRLLAGDGGDELFGGNARYAKQRVFGWYDHVPGLLRAGLLEPLLARRWAAAAAAQGRQLHRQARVPMPDRLQTYNLLLRLGPSEVLTPGFLARWTQARRCSSSARSGRPPRPTRELDRMLAFDWRYTLAESDLPKVRGHRAGRLEVGFPLLDDGLLDFSLRLPTEYKLKGLKLRWFFKEALRGFLPDEIITKKKHGFGLPFGVWANRHAGCRPWLAERCAQPGGARAWCGQRSSKPAAA